MDGRRGRIVWTFLAAGFGLAAVLLVTHRSDGFRTITPGAPSGDRVVARGGALSPLPRTPVPAAGPFDDAIALADLRAGALAARREGGSREADSLLASTHDTEARAAVCRALRPVVADARLVARLATETDPVAIPAAVAFLARVPGTDAEDAIVRLVGRAGPRVFPDVVEEVLARDDQALASALVAVAASCLSDSGAPERERILDRIADAPDLPEGVREWASREPDPELRERLESLVSGEGTEMPRARAATIRR